MYNAALNRRTIKTSYQLTVDTVGWLALSRRMNARLIFIVRNHPAEADRIEALIVHRVEDEGVDPGRWTSFLKEIM